MWNSRHGRRIWGRLVIVLILLAIGVASIAGRVLVVDAPERSDVILVLAGETDRRPARGLELLDQGYGRRLVIDVPAAEKIFGFTNVELAQKYIQALPEAPSVSLCPIEGLSTRDEAHDAEKCLRQEDGARVLIVTSDYHTRRAFSIFRHEIRNRSFFVAAARDDREFGTLWWTHREWAKTCLYEWMRLAWWNVVDRWR